MNKLIHDSIKQANLKPDLDIHTILLYGSYARGDFCETSDLDIACFAKTNDNIKKAFVFQGQYIDLFLYPETVLSNPDSGFLHLMDSKVIRDQLNLADPFLEELNRIFKEGPQRMSEEDFEHLSAWIEKMLERVCRNDLDGKYRRSWLQFDLLRLYFEVRGMWFLGHKKVTSVSKGQGTLDL